MNQDTWPYNPSSPKVEGKIAWKYADPGAWATMTTAHILAIDAADFRVLLMDSSYREAFKANTSKYIQECVVAKIEGRKLPPAPVEEKVKKEKEKPKDKRDGVKEALRAELEEVTQAAISNDNLTARLQAIKLKAELEALLNRKEEVEDRVINIYVNSGVDRG